jgi:hypothetical protein
MFDRIVGRPRPAWITFAVALLLFLAPATVAWGGNGIDELVASGKWRGILIPPTIITYILVIAPRLSRVEKNVLASFRKLVLVDDEVLEKTVREAAYIRPRNEWISMAVGGIVGVVTILASFDESVSPLYLVWFGTTTLMYGILAWTIYISLAGTRLTAALLRQPLEINLFDITPFEAFGRQSLLLSLVFIGGITLSLIFVGFDASTLSNPAFWFVYVPLVMVPIVIFFLNMYPAQQVLAEAKRREIQEARGHLQRSGRELVQRLNKKQTAENLPAEVWALAAYLDELQKTRTWPYNTAMMRTLFFSVLIPLATVLGRVLLEKLML